MENKIITIYTDPISMNKPEGEAELIEKIHDYYFTQYWKVKFIGDDSTSNRTINKKQLEDKNERS